MPKIVPFVSEYRFTEDRDIRVTMRMSQDGTHRWAVFNGSSCLNTLGEWEYEPMPSSREEEYLERTRYTKDEALRLAQNWIKENPTRLRKW